MGRERPLFLPFLCPLGFCVFGRKGWHYSPECVEGRFCEVTPFVALRSTHGRVVRVACHRGKRGATLCVCENPPEEQRVTINRTQALVLGFFVVVWATLVALFALAPEVYYRALKLSSAGAGLLFLLGISAFIALLGIGVMRRWRWTFWLIAFAFLFGVLRIPASVLALEGVLPADGPTWYVLYQAFVGLVQFAIAVLMLVGYRRAGTWGAF